MKNIIIYNDGQLNKYLITVVIFLLILMNSKAFAFQYNEYKPESHKWLWTGNLNIFIGQKALEKDEWWPVEKQREFGLELDFKRNNWPFSLAIEFLCSKDDGMYVDSLVVDFNPEDVNFNVEGETFEFNFGFRKIIRLPKKIRPFFGGGISYIQGKIKGEARSTVVSDSDKDFGYWLSGGTYWTIDKSFNFGFELKYSYTKLDLFDEADAPATNAGGIHLGILIGYHW